MLRLPRVVLALATAAAVLVPAGEASAVSGRIDSTDSNVGAIGVTVGDGTWRLLCTGTLISSDQFLTAHHCVDGIEILKQQLDVTGVWVSFETDLRGYIDALTPALGGSVDLSGLKLYSSTQAPLLLPGYHGGANPAFNDLAIFLLDASVDDVEPVVLPEPNVLDSLHVTDRPAITAVGYGLSYAWLTGPGRSATGDPKVLQWDGARRIGDVSFQGVTTTQLVTNQNASSRLPGGTCLGDSGGPLFYPYQDGGSKVQVAVTVWGDIPCRAIGFAQRLDLPDVLQWINANKH